MDFRPSQGRPGRPQQPTAPRPSLQPVQVDPPSSKQNTSHLKNKYVLGAIVIGVVVCAGIAAWLQLQPINSPRSDRYQAVFLDNDRVFFGKLKNTTGEYLRLEHVYSTRANSNTDKAIDAGGDISLVKVEGFVYGPEDAMMIRAEKVKFWQDLTSDSKVAKAMDNAE